MIDTWRKCNFIDIIVMVVAHYCGDRFCLSSIYKIHFFVHVYIIIGIRHTFLLIIFFLHVEMLNIISNMFISAQLVYDWIMEKSTIKANNTKIQCLLLIILIIIKYLIDWFVMGKKEKKKYIKFNYLNELLHYWIKLLLLNIFTLLTVSVKIYLIEQSAYVKIGFRLSIIRRYIFSDSPKI